MKSIKIKLVLTFGGIISVLCILLAGIAYLTAKDALLKNINKTLPEISVQASNNVVQMLEGTLDTLESIANGNTIRNVDIPWEDKEKALIEEVKRSGHIKMGIANTNGDIKYTDGKEINIKDRDYFINALSGKSFVSDPLVSKADGSIVIVYSVPIKAGNKIVGVLTATRDGNALSNLTDKITFGSTGKAFMLNKQGTTIAHSNRDLVINMDNDFENIKTDKSLEGLVDIEKKMVAGDTGHGEYRYKGADKYVAYAPVNTTSWSLAVVIEKNEVLSELIILERYMIVIALVLLLLGTLITWLVSSRITKGIKDTSEHLNLFAKGDLSKEISQKYLNLKDEVGDMAKAMSKMQESLSSMIKNIKESSSSIDMQAESLSAVSEEMSLSAQDVSTAIQDVSGGAGTQAENLVDITSSLNEFGMSLDNIVTAINEVEQNTKGIDHMANNSGTNMKNLVDSVGKVNKSFTEFSSKISTLVNNINYINDITNLINNISDQTNLLALNAAIEAARAGESGRGFAVVADEIRKLAEQSKSSSESISRLIGNINQESASMIDYTNDMKNEIDGQVSIINSTITAFNKIIEGIRETTPMMQNINDNAQGIRKEKDSILQKIESASAIAEEVSASSEEIAASSEQISASTQEVSSSAQILTTRTKEMLEKVNEFII